MGRRLFKELERSYGFDEVAIVPGQVTINPELTSTKMTIGDLDFEIPIMASAMDGAVSPGFASYMHEMGGLGVLNAEGLYSRYEDPYSVLEEIISHPQETVTEFLQKVYSEPIREGLIGQRHLRGLLHPPDQQAHVSCSRGGRGRHGCGPVHRHHCPAHVQ